MSSSMAVMKDGVVEQLGVPQELYDYPRTRFVASFLGAANLLDARIISVGDGGSELFRFEAETDWGAKFTAFGRHPFLAGDQVSVAVRTEGMALSANHEGRDSATDPWAGVVESVQVLGDSMEYYVKIRNVSLRTRSDRSQNFRVGDPVFIELRSEACTIVAD